jgi:hypothetical protein
MVRDFLWKVHSYSACQRIACIFMEPDGSLPCSTKLATGPCPESA